MINSNELCNYSNYIELPNYIEHHPATSDKVGAPLFISKQLNYKNRNDLNLCQKNIKNTHRKYYYRMYLQTPKIIYIKS